MVEVSDVDFLVVCLMLFWVVCCGVGFGLVLRLISWFWDWFVGCCGWLTSCISLCFARWLGLLLCELL